jgi:iron complex outermembrane receptor protein
VLAGFLVVGLFPARAVAQTPAANIVGTVVAAANGAPVHGAAVSVDSVAEGVVTRTDGRFVLVGVPEGLHVVEVSILGYLTAQQLVEVPASGHVDLVIQLQATAIEVDPLVVTATLDRRAGADALRPVKVLGGRDLERRLGPTLAETLAEEPGVAVASMGPAPARPVIRGFAGDRVLLLEDGQRIGDVSSTSSDHAVATEGSSAEQIEVIRGPATLFYGSNALGGVVNTVRHEIPSTPIDRPTGTALLQGQTVYQSMFGSGTVEVPLGGFIARGEISGRNSGDMRQPDEELDNSDLRVLSGAAALSRAGQDGYAGVGFRIYDTEYGIPPDSISGHPSGVRVDLNRAALRGSGELRRSFGPFEHLKAEGGLTRYDHSEIEASGRVGTAFDRSTYYLEAEAHHEEAGPFASGGVGVRAYLENYFSDNGRDQVDSRGTTLSVFGVEEWRNGPLAIQGGIRLDYTAVEPQNEISIRGIEAKRRSFAPIAFSLAGLYEVASDVRVGMSLSRSTRTPSSEELFSLGPHLAAYTYEVGNPDLNAETGLGADLFLRISRQRLKAEIVGFTSTIQDFIYAENTGQQRGSLYVYRFANTGARYSGAEASLEWNATGNWVFGGSASWVSATDTEADDPLPWIPPLNGLVFARFQGSSWFADTSVRWAAQQDRVPERPELPANSPGYCDETAPGELCRAVPGEFLPTDGYAALGASLGYRWWAGRTTHSITLRVENITNTTYRNHLSRLKELAVEPGVGLSVSYRWSF